MKNLFKINLFLMLFLGCWFVTSCSKDVIVSTDVEQSRSDFFKLDSAQRGDLVKFARILSKSVYNSEPLRLFLKKEALQMFDRNYDILYYPNRNKKISGNLSFRDILVSNSSEKEILDIEKNFPLLNILVPRISFLDVFPEKLDVKDTEIPVAIENAENGIDLFLNGKKVDTFDSNEFPGFNVFVVNQNNRVVASRMGHTRSAQDSMWSYDFKSENYNGLIQTRVGNGNFNHNSRPSYLYKKAEAAFEAGFNKDDNTKNQIAFQRDYIYYGMTPNDSLGELNRSVTEYLSYMIVDPKKYFSISDEQTNYIEEDPHLRTKEIENKTDPLSREEVLKKMWTEGAYNFIFEISSSKSKESSKMPVPVFPDEIWDFKIKKSFKKGGWFHRDKYRYTIDPKEFTSKVYYFDPATVTFGKWNITEESIIRYISIYEEDSGADVTETSTESFSHVKSSNFKGDVKLGLGLGKIGGKISTADLGFSSEVNSSNTVTTTNTITIKRHQGDDLLGYKIPIYFYDPIIKSKRETLGGVFDGSSNGSGFGGHRGRSLNHGSFGNGRRSDLYNIQYEVHEYNSGSIRFGIDVR